MATALAKGLIDAKFCEQENVIAFDISDDVRQRFAAETGAVTAKSNNEVVSKSQAIILAVKPQHMPDVLEDIKDHVSSNHLVISIAAGVTLDHLERCLGSGLRLIRVMPNTPCLVGESASGFALGNSATEDDGRFVQGLLSTVGMAFQVDEHLLDAVTGLSGSGPAFVYEVIEALSDGGVHAGLPRNIAAQLAAQTVLGAAQMVLTTEEHPAALKDAVASPGGTTIAGLHELEKGGLRATLMNAVIAASRRSQELGQSS